MTEQEALRYSTTVSNQNRIRSPYAVNAA
jgi:hypothetical protein